MKFIKNIKTVLLFFVLLHFIGCNTKTNWQENYKESSKDPFGLYVLYNELESLNNYEKVHNLNKNINDYLSYNYTEPNSNFGSYFCVKDNASRMDYDGVESLLSFVFDGNTAFLALNSFDYTLKKKLGFNVKNERIDVALKNLSGALYLKNTNFKNQPYFFNKNLRANYFETFNKNTTIILGTNEINGEKKPNFIKIYHGKGAIYLHTNPIVFTNYYVLANNENYVENILSYMPKSEILWDPLIRYSSIPSEQTTTSNKESESVPEEKHQNSIFKFFLQHKTLTWFLFVSLFGMLLFLLFNARRKQRIIPVIAPLENTTVAFTQTIASLYLKEGNHKNIIDKKINFFLEKVRKNYLIDTSNLNTDFIEKLASKSDNDLQKTKYLIHSIIDLNKKIDCTEEQLIVLHKMIDNFFKK